MKKNVIFDKKIVLVAGGAGFLGSHLCDELIKTSKVICVDDFSTGEERNIDHLLSEPNFEFVKHDLTQPINLDDLPELQKFKIKFQGVQEIYNLACPMSVNNFNKNKIKTVLANSHATKNTLDMAIKYNAKYLLFSSSVVYGPENVGKKISEGNIQKIDFLSERSAYDEGKRFAETMVNVYREEARIDAKILRIFRTYGPRMPLNDGQMLPDFINNALENKDIIIYGDKNFSSSLCYVSDCVDGAIKMMKSESAGPLNIGSDVLINITEVASKIINILGSKSKIKYAESKLFMTPLSLPDISRAKNEIGWLPIVTLDKGLKLTIEDLRASKGIKKPILEA